MTSPSNRDYYSVNAVDYIKRIDAIDPTEFLSPFIKYLPENSLVLDVGCGSGRDLLWLKKRGFQVFGLEQSKKLALYAEQKTSVPIICADFETHSFSQFKVDGLVLSAALVHVSQQRFCKILGRIIQAIKDSGILYLSLKEDIGQTEQTDGRDFVYWNQVELESCLSSLPLTILEFSRTSSPIKTREIFLHYILKKSKTSNS